MNSSTGFPYSISNSFDEYSNLITFEKSCYKDSSKSSRKSGDCLGWYMEPATILAGKANCLDSVPLGWSVFLIPSHPVDNQLHWKTLNPSYRGFNGYRSVLWSDPWQPPGGSNAFIRINNKVIKMGYLIWIILRFYLVSCCSTWDILFNLIISTPAHFDTFPESLRSNSKSFNPKTTSHFQLFSESFSTPEESDTTGSILVNGIASPILIRMGSITFFWDSSVLRHFSCHCFCQRSVIWS